MSELKVRITGDGRGFANALKKADADARGFAKNIGGGLLKEVNMGIANSIPALTSAIAGAFTIGAARDLMKFADDMSTLSASTGISTENLQVYNEIAKKTGVTVRDITGAIMKLARAQVDAVSDTMSGQKKLQFFEQFGISIEDLKSKSPERLFIQLSDAIKNSEISANMFDAAMEIMGKKSESVIPAMRQGFSELAEQIKASGKIIDEDLIDKLAEMNSKVEGFWGILKPILAQVTVWVSEIGTGFLDIEKILFGGVARFAGALSSGSSFKEAFKAFQDNFNEVLDRRIKEQQEADRKRAERQKVKPGAEALEDLQDKASKEKEIERINERIAKIKEKTELEGLSKEEQRVKLAERRAKLEQEILDLAGKPDMDSKLKAAEKREKLAEIDQGIKELDTRPIKSTSKDSLATIGGFRGSGVTDPVPGLIQETNKKLDKIIENTTPTEMGPLQ